MKKKKKKEILFTRSENERIVSDMDKRNSYRTKSIENTTSDRILSGTKHYFNKIFSIVSIGLTCSSTEYFDYDKVFKKR